jgi:hypothetical protein
MHNFPDAVFRSKDARSPQSHRCDLLPSGDFDPEALYLHNEGKLRSYVLHYILKGGELAITVQGCSALHCRSDLLPPIADRAKGVSDAYVIPMREQHLARLRVPINELACRLVILPNYFVKIICRSHL